jgi:hypothetical protein
MALEGATRHRKANTMRKKYFGFEQAFEHIWNRAEADGLWDGDATTLAAAFCVTEDDAHDTLCELCDRGLLEHLFQGNYAITRWRERDEPDEEDHN